jgi:hypothetical protein
MNNSSAPELLKKVINGLMSPPEFHRFEVFQGEKDAGGKVTKTKSVGMAYIKSGDQRYGLRLFTFSDDRFYLLPDRNDPKAYLILTSTPNRGRNTERKYIWNVIGSGKVNTNQGLIELQFDLFEKPLYLNIFPERSATGTKIPEPIFFDEAS